MNRHKRRLAEAWARKGDETFMPTAYRVLADGRIIKHALMETQAHSASQNGKAARAFFRRIERLRGKK